MKYIIGYHANCNDGLMAAACIAYAISDLNDAVFLELDYSDKSEAAFVDLVKKHSEEELECVDVMIVDYCPKAGVLTQLSKLVVEDSNGFLDVTVLDHHETSIAKEAVDRIHDKYPGIIFTYESDKSGAGLAWDYISDYVDIEPRPVPLAVQYVQDRDLWKFEFGQATKQFHAYTRLVDRNPVTWMETFLHESIPMDLMLAKGQALLEEDAQEISRLMANAKFIPIQVNGLIAMAAIFRCERKDLVSETCHSLLKQRPDIDVAICVSELNEAEGSEGYVWSIRSMEATPSCISAQTIAKFFGGGGHRNAAGFHTKTFFEVVGNDYLTFSDLEE